MQSDEAVYNLVDNRYLSIGLNTAKLRHHASYLGMMALIWSVAVAVLWTAEPPHGVIAVATSVVFGVTLITAELEWVILEHWSDREESTDA